MDKIAERIVKPLQKRLACYYGCLLVRPPKVSDFDRPEDPQSMDNLVRRIGATPVEWAFKTECCGAGFSVSRTDLVAKLSGQILDDAESPRRRGRGGGLPHVPLQPGHAPARASKTPGQEEIRPCRSFTSPRPSGLALGLSAKKLGLHRHMVSRQMAERCGPPKRAGRRTGSSAMARIGVFICHCGENIGATVDASRSPRPARRMPGVVHSVDYKYMCSDPGQKMIKNAIGEKHLTGVVVAACSPRMHEPTFRRACAEAGLNPYPLRDGQHPRALLLGARKIDADHPEGHGPGAHAGGQGETQQAPACPSRCR